MKTRHYWLSKEIFFGLFLGVLLVAPVLVMSGPKQIFVDRGADGSEDGSREHPYHSIGKALKNAPKGAEVFVAKGTYKENITIPKDVKLLGRQKDRGDVVIKGKNDDKSTVTMEDDSSLSHVTVQDGKDGIRVEKNAKAHIFNVVVKSARRDGVHIESAKNKEKSHRAFLDTVTLEKNGKAGLYAESRLVVIVDSRIKENRSDGVVFEKNVKGWIEGTSITSNRASGARIDLGGAEVYTKRNSIVGNGREGVEINAYGSTGNVGFKKDRIQGNGRYGIARVVRAQVPYSKFANVSLGAGGDALKFGANKHGDVSPLISVR